MTIRRGTRQTGWWLAVVLCCAGCAGGDTGQGPEPAADEAPRDWFVDRAVESGLDIVHFNGMSGEFYYPEIMGPGVALIDYDGDGDLDVYIVQGQMLGRAAARGGDASRRGPLRDRLFRNDLTVHPDGTRTMRFVDVTEEAGIDLTTYGMGVAVGDYTNNGFPDIYRTGLQGSVLLRNNGDGTFTDIRTTALRWAPTGRPSARRPPTSTATASGEDLVDRPSQRGRLCPSPDDRRDVAE
jgi:enediyne biosynthesis protein E4